jgi:hypothetical protein
MPIFTSCNGYYRDIHKDTTTILLVLYNTMLFVVAPKAKKLRFLLVLRNLPMQFWNIPR